MEETEFQLFPLDDYSISERVSEGRTGVVYKGKNKKTGRLVALKIIKYQRDTEEGGEMLFSALREISLLKQLRHPNIVSLLDVIIGNRKENPKLCYYPILEFLETDLGEYIRSIAPDQYMDPKLVKSYVYQINQALLFCHQRGVIHRDLKPQNLLINKDGLIKLADFGAGRKCGQPGGEICTSGMVTLWYRAPEILLGAPKYSCPIDIWSIGCIFAEMDMKEILFKGDSEIGHLLKIFQILRTPTEEIWKGVSSLPGYTAGFPKWTDFNLKKSVKNLKDDGTDLLGKMLLYDPGQRISAESIAVHPYFNDLDLNVKPFIVESQ
ncbi:unnamed protein product [Ceutorhynchus assimilis]|uniref:Protein kinase domain-containing protein n=1 Tax=Ceutorhynchus assimilis TaxID=467358 RepID=A0A9N9MIP9_9CUCU|nr:unnamed protein product [Ceutorhynchus assimilis]